MVDIAINGSGIRDTARVLNISRTTILNRLKKEKNLLQVNPNFFNHHSETEVKVRVGQVCNEAEIDEQWSFVRKKSNQRWLWHAVCHETNTVLAYVFGKRKDVVFKELKEHLLPFGITRFYTDDWGAYERNLDSSEHELGKKIRKKLSEKI